MVDVLNITIIFEGQPIHEKCSADTKDEDVIKTVLPDPKKHQANEYDLYDPSNVKLDPNRSLNECGIKDGDTLSLVKKQGGGGNYLLL